MNPSKEKERGDRRIDYTGTVARQVKRSESIVRGRKGVGKGRSPRAPGPLKLGCRRSDITIQGSTSLREVKKEDQRSRLGEKGTRAQ